MALAQAGTADIQDRDHDHPVIAGFLNDSSDLKEMNIDVLGEDSKNCHEGPHLDQLPDEKEDGVEGDEADRSGLSSYLFTSSQPVSPNTITLAPAHARSSTPISPDYEDLISDEDEVGFGPLSPLETLPTELVQSIATQTSFDQDLGRLALTSPTFATKLNSDGADVWRKRFLALYDYPILQSVHEFAMAYKVRRFILRKLDGRALALGQGDRAEHQLQVIKDMILETYNKHKPHLPPPTFSKNLTALASPSTSPWVLKFMGCALYENERTKYGRPHMLFDTLQVTLSHLVLSQRSPVLLSLPSSRDNYDLARVYNYNKPLVMLLERLKDEPEDSRALRKSKRSAKLDSPHPEPGKTRYEVDMHALLHIRNFWQRHFADDVQGIGENTYAPMARSLVALGKTPQKWDRPLQEQVPLHTKWYGHYSCLHPWPKSRQDLEERQSCAEDWKHIDPMILDFERSASNEDGAFWPLVFSTIPAFADLMPNDREHNKYNVMYLRGIAPFLELEHRDRHKNEQSDTETDISDKFPKWHPFLASRVHGFVHDIPDGAILGRKPRRERFSDSGKEETEKAIPGWKHIVMIIYKPTSRQILSVLDHAMEDYGGASGANTNFNTADIWNGADGTNDTDTQAPEQTQQTQHQTSTAGTATQSTNNAPQNAPTTPNDADADPTDEQIEARLRFQITRRLKTYSEIYRKRAEEIKNYEAPAASPYRINQKPKAPPKPLPALFSPEHIRLLAEAHSSATYMTWDDGTIDYAYAYEGVIVPGGKIMLGRWWRIHSVEGMGKGKEIGSDAVGVEVRPVVQPETSGDASFKDDTKKGKRKAKKQGVRKGKRKSTRKKTKRKVATSDTDEEGEGEDEHDADYEDEDYGAEEDVEPEKEVEYEFVTMLNGEESRAVNACKGLERGPFVFWTG